MRLALCPMHYVSVYKTLVVSSLYMVAWTCLDSGLCIDTKVSIPVLISEVLVSVLVLVKES
jgi:hypothetical protein